MSDWKPVDQFAFESFVSDNDEFKQVYEDKFINSLEKKVKMKDSTTFDWAPLDQFAIKSFAIDDKLKKVFWRQLLYQFIITIDNMKFSARRKMKVKKTGFAVLLLRLPRIILG